MGISAGITISMLMKVSPNDAYLLSVLQKYSVVSGPGSAAEAAATALYPFLRRWAGVYFVDVKYAGSYAKGTAVRGRADLDLFVSLSADTPGTLEEIYSNLFQHCAAARLNPRKQDVSIGITYNSLSVDLVPGRQQLSSTSNHSLYRRRADTWMLSNIDTHIAVVRGSRVINEIRAIKIWRQLHHLDIPSFYLELSVIRALDGSHITSLADRICHVLQYFSTDFSSARIVDPSNSNNIISNDLTVADKQRVAAQAKLSLTKKDWGQIIW